MRYSTTGQFGCQCDALCLNGQRCTRRNHVVIPNVISGGKTGLAYVYGRQVRLCHTHANMFERLKRVDKRLPLRERGFLGAYNQYKFGSVVLSEAYIDWRDPKLSTSIPKFWSVDDCMQ